MSCLDFAEVISAYLDGEASAEERTALEQHLPACPECAARLESFRALKHAVTRLQGRAMPPEAVWARVEALRFRSPSSRLRARLFTAALALIALALGGLATTTWLQNGVARRLPEELVADHLRSAPDVMPAEITSPDPGEVRRFFEAKVPFKPVVPALGAATLVGGRVCKIEGRKVQLLFYELSDRKLSLYVSDRAAQMDACHTSGEHCVCGKKLRGLSLMLVGRGPEDEMRRLLDEAVL